MSQGWNPIRPTHLPSCGSGGITSGDGSSSGFWESKAFVTSMSPRMLRRWWAMTACCSSPQWFSRDRITGYGDNCRGGGVSGKTGNSSESPPAGPCPTQCPNSFKTGRQRQGGGKPTLRDQVCKTWGILAPRYVWQGQRSDRGSLGQSGVVGGRGQLHRWLLYTCSFRVSGMDHAGGVCRNPTAEPDLCSQKSWLSSPPLSPKVLCGKLGGVHTFVRGEDGRREHSVRLYFTLRSCYSHSTW